MWILVNSQNIIIAKGENIEFGVYDEDFKKWKIQISNSIFYFIDSNYKCIEVPDTPSDVMEYKYCYSREKGFYLNTFYSKPINLEGNKKVE
jgi:hypothetical protein